MKYPFFSSMIAGSTAIALTFPVSASVPLETTQTSRAISATATVEPEPTISRDRPDYLMAQQLMAQQSEFPALEINIDDLTVLSYGDEPLQTLQIQPLLNTQQQAVVSFDIVNGQITVAGQTQPFPALPTTSFTMITAVTDIDEVNNRFIEFEYTDVAVGESATLPAEVIAQARSQLNQLVGLSGSWLLSPQGNSSQFTLVPPADMSPLMSQSLQQMVSGFQQMSAPFPSEAIGVGAQWQTPYTLSVNGLPITGDYIYELTERDGNRVTLAVTITQQGGITGSEAIDLGLPADASINFSSEGYGTITMDLEQVLPIQSNLSMTSDTAVLVQGQETTTALEMIIMIDSQPLF